MIAKTFVCFACLALVNFLLLLLSLDTATATFLGHGPVVATGGGGANGTNSKCVEKERHALLKFKADHADLSGRLSTWSVEDDCCRWSGVACSQQNGHVIELDLSYDQGLLTGEISPWLFNLTYLSYLDLSGNSFNGTIPKSMASFTELSYLDLSWNSFHGTIPPELGNLTNLRHLSFGGSMHMVVENLDWLSRLSLLQHLDIQEVSLAKANHWVDVILSLEKLSYLGLSGCDLTQVASPYSRLLNSSSSSSIASLDVSYNDLNSSAYHWLFPLTSNGGLSKLDLSGNMLDGIPGYLGNICSLTYLDFASNSAYARFSDFINNLSPCAAVALQRLDVRMNRLTGSLSDGIQKFSSLKVLLLGDNQLNGTISEKLWETVPQLFYLDASSNDLRGVIHESFGRSNLRHIDLSNNSLEGVVSEVQMSNLSFLQHLDLSLNPLTFELRSHWTPHFQLDHIGLNSCKLGPHFPKWIQTQRQLTYLSIANCSISDAVPVWFWGTSLSRLRYLNISSNNITGEVTHLLANTHLYSTIDLSSNNLHGPIPNVPSNLISLNLSRNKFYGGVSFLCQIVDGFLNFLDLSRNSLTGQLPDCLSHFMELKVLNLAHNNLSGSIPSSIGFLIQLEVLYVYSNSFSGELPLALKNCTRLTFLDLGANRFFGNVPAWIGENLSGLYALSLRSNNFFGSVPSQVCQLANIQILDLSMNKLHGTIPTCFNNLTAMVQEGLSSEITLHNYTLSYAPRSVDDRYFGSDYFVDYAIIEWQGNEREFNGINLGLLKSIDLSNNNLSGQIPDELTALHQVLALNLSKNALNGEVPWKIGEMNKLLTLDLSRNHLSGGMPSSMAALTSLNYLDLSYNNLSGRIPSSTQLQSFDPSRYIGNDGLCGPPISKNCPGDEVPEASSADGPNQGGDDDEGIDESQRWFYIGGGIGFATGFWIACGTLLVNRHGRHAFFRFLDHLKDWIYVKVAVFSTKLRRVAHK